MNVNKILKNMKRKRYKLKQGQKYGIKSQFRGYSYYKKGEAHRNLRAGQKGYMRVSGNYKRYEKNGELKYWDGSWSQANVASTGQIIKASLNLIPQGTGPSARIGRKVVIKKIQLFVQNDLITGTKPNDSIRIILYQDKQCNGATATVTDILDGAFFKAWRNLENSGRFRLLWDRTIDLQPGAAVINATTDVVQIFGTSLTEKYFVDCNIPIEFDSTTGAITEIKSNNIGLLLITIDDQVQANGFWRIRYSDN